MEKTAGLSAPEAFVLMSLPKFDARRALKLGFMGLLAQGVLRLEQEDRRGLIRTRHIPHLFVRANPRTPLPPIAESLIGVVRAAEPGGLMQDVVKQAMRRYGRTLAGFAVDHIVPALVGHGFAEPHQSRLLGLVPRTRYFRTPAGEGEKIRLDGLLQDARTIPRFLDSDPVQAAALVAALGGAILLVEELRPHYQAIAAAMRPPGEGGDAGGVDFGGANDNGIDAAAAVDFGGIDFGAFDAALFDGFDAGFADAGGDGGGDGGDGGSSGC